MDAPQKLDRLSDLLKVDPSNLALRRDCVDAALLSKRYDVALELAEAGLVQAPLDDALRFNKSNALIGCGEYHSALGVLSELHALHPQNVAVAQNLALCEYIVGNFTQARAHLEGLYASGDRSVGVVRMLVSSCHHLGLMDRAVTVADENRELARTDSALAGAFAMVYLDDSRAVDAARCAAYSLRANPRCIDALTVDATLRLAAGDVETAKKVFEDLVSVNPNLGRAWVGLGSMALLQRDFAQAKLDLTRGVETMPGHVGSWHMLGWTHLMAGELSDAERVFDHAMELNHNFAETHGALAAIAAMRGHQDKAQEMIKVALRLDPACLSAQFAQSVIAANSGDPMRSQQLMGDAFNTLAKLDASTMSRLLAVATRDQNKK
jgi:tetratricopeptide (TPR) repeat protein